MRKLLRIKGVKPLEGHRLQLTLTNGIVVERDVESMLWGPVFEPIRSDRSFFERVQVDELGGITWPNGADVCPDVLIWGGMPPKDQAARPEPFMRLQSPSGVEATG